MQVEDEHFVRKSEPAEGLLGFCTPSFQLLHKKVIQSIKLFSQLRDRSLFLHHPVLLLCALWNHRCRLAVTYSLRCSVKNASGFYACEIGVHALYGKAQIKQQTCHYRAERHGSLWNTDGHRGWIVKGMWPVQMGTRHQTNEVQPFMEMSKLKAIILQKAEVGFLPFYKCSMGDETLLLNNFWWGEHLTHSRVEQKLNRLSVSPQFLPIKFPVPD